MNPIEPPTPPRSPLLRYGPWGLLVLCLLLFFTRLGSVPLFDLDEALYVTCARQMAQTGDFITPRLNSRPLENPALTSVPFFEKPILVYWASAASLRLFGFSEWAARLPVALAALTATLLIAWVGTVWFGLRAGLLAGAVYATAPMVLVDARQMTTDGLLVLWFTLALIAFWQCSRETPSPPTPLPMLGEGKTQASPFSQCWEKGARGMRAAGWLWPLLFWLSASLAALTKGAIGLLLPSLVIGVFLLINRWRYGQAPWPTLRRLRPLLGLLLFFTLITPWHLLIAGRGERDAQGRTFVQEYIVRQHIGRFKGGDKVHNAPLPTYVLYFLVFFFPWACFTPAAFRYGPGRPKQPTTGNTGDTGKNKENTEIASSDSQGNLENPLRDPRIPRGSSLVQEERHRFLLVWFWTIFVFFTLGAAKLPTYLAPAYPAAALLMGRWLDRALAATAVGQSVMARSLRRGGMAATLTAGFLFIAALAAPHYAPAKSPIPPDVAHIAVHLTGVLLLGCGVAWVCFLRGEGAAFRRQCGVGALLVMMVALVGIGCTEGYAIADRSVLSPYQQIAAAARPDAEAGLPVIFYHIIPRRPSMLAYAGYSPVERKETPLLPFLRALLPDHQTEADVITSRASLESELLPEIQRDSTVALRVQAENRDGNGGWLLIRLKFR